MRACLQRLREKGQTLNKKKWSFLQSSDEFFGNIFSEKGIAPDPTKISAIKEAGRPRQLQTPG